MLPTWSQLNPFAKADRKASGAEPVPTKQANVLDVDDPTKGKDIDPKTGKPRVQVSDDPISNLESLWQPNLDKDGKAVPDDTDTGPYMPVLDPKKLTEMVEKMNFTEGVTEEEIAALKEGGEKSMGAMMNMLNRAGRKSFLTAFQASNKLAEQGLSKAQERFMKGIPSHVRDMMVDSGLGESIPIMKNPMFAPLVSNVKSQFLKKFPKATPQQVTEGVNQYFKKMQDEFTAGNKPQNTDINEPNRKLRQGAPDADFEAWLGDEINQIGSKGGMFQETEESQQ